MIGYGPDLTNRGLCTQVEVPDGKSECTDRSRRKFGMSRPSQTESRYVHTVPDGKSVCPDSPRRIMPMSRLWCVLQTFRAFMVRLSCVHQIFRAFMSRFSCIHQTFAFKRISCVYVRTFVRSPDFCAFMFRLSSVNQIFVCSPDLRAFMSRLSCIQQTFVSS